LNSSGELKKMKGIAKGLKAIYLLS